MARDLAIFMQPLHVGDVGEAGETSPSPGDGGGDVGAGARGHRSASHLHHGARHVGKLAAAADRIEELLGRRIYDIRLISIYLSAAFHEGGVAVLPGVLAATLHLLGDSFEAVGPVRKREEHFDRRLAWLYEGIGDALAYHEQKRTDEWKAWGAALTSDVLAEAIAQSDLLGEQIRPRGFTNAAGELGQLRSWLYSHRLPAAPAVEAPADAPPSQSRSSVRPAGPAATPTQDGSRPALELVVSHRFLELRDKLRAFEVLIEKGEFRKAALVADDVQKIVEHFDPRSYFPDVFAGFSARLSKHIESLAEHWEERESVSWKAMDQYYQVDLDGFVES